MLQVQTADMIDEAVEAIRDLEPALRRMAPLPERSVYRPSRRQDLGAGMLAVAVVAMLIASFAWMREPVVRHAADPLKVIDLRTLTPPPPRPAPKAIQHAAPHPQPIVALPPVVAVPALSPVVTAPTPASTPAPPAPIVQAPPAPAAAPAVPTAAAPADGGDLSSRMIAGKPPSYPLDSRRKNEEGIVVLTVLLDTGGRVADIAVAESSGFDRLDRAALGAVRQWRWAPLIKNGMPVAVQGRVKIPFVLKH